MADKMAKSPIGTKTTHAMFCEFTQHPSDIIKSQNDIGVMQLKIPRLKNHELASLRLTPTVQLAHYNGPPKLNPTYLPVVALSPEKTVQADTYRARARAWDATGLFHVHTEDKPVEWACSTHILPDERLAHPPRSQRHLVPFSMRHLPTLTRS